MKIKGYYPLRWLKSLWLDHLCSLYLSIIWCKICLPVTQFPKKTSTWRMKIYSRVCRHLIDGQLDGIYHGIFANVCCTPHRAKNSAANRGVTSSKSKAWWLSLCTMFDHVNSFCLRPGTENCTRSTSMQTTGSKSPFVKCSSESSSRERKAAQIWTAKLSEGQQLPWRLGSGEKVMHKDSRTWASSWRNAEEAEATWSESLWLLEA